MNDQLGVFSAEANLAAIGSIQLGAVSARLPSFRTEVYTDGGWLIDFGFPWNNDFRRSFQSEAGVLLGSGGFYFGKVAASAVASLKLDKAQNGFDPPAPSNAYLINATALRAGVALRVGIGRSIDLGVLKGEASLTAYGSLEGAVAFDPGTSNPRLYSIVGVIGVMINIWAELDFVVLHARAEICAYTQLGFELRKVAAMQGGKYYAVSLPLTIIAEVGISLHFEVWVKIGCIYVKLFDLNFNARLRLEEPLGELSWEDLPAGAQTRSRNIHMLPPEKTWVSGYAQIYDPENVSEEILLYATSSPASQILPTSTLLPAWPTSHA